MKLPSYFFPVLSIELKKLVAYRIDFWLRLLCTTAGRVAVGYFLWKAIFDAKQGQLIGGFSLEGMVLYYVLASLTMNGVVVFGGFISREIYDGSHSRFLVYPVSFFLFKYCTCLAQQLMSIVQISLAALIVVITLGNPPTVALSIQSALLGSGSILVAGALFYSWALNAECMAFWLEKTFALTLSVFLIINYFGGLLLPLSLFPASFLHVLEFTPLPYLVYLPVQTFLGAVTPYTWLQNMIVPAIWIVIFQASARAIYARGTRVYTGVGM